MPADCSADAAPAPFIKRTKHRLSSKARLLSLDSLDRRTKVAQSCDRLIAGLQADLGKDMSVAQGELAKRAALLSALAEHCEVLWLKGQPIVIGDYVAVCNTLRRTLSALSPSLERQPREIEGVNPDQFNNVWPQYRAAEAQRVARQGRDLATILADVLERDDANEPPKPDSEPPVKEDDLK
jgi:hypothetical protein